MVMCLRVICVSIALAEYVLANDEVDMSPYIRQREPHYAIVIDAVTGRLQFRPSYIAC